MISGYKQVIVGDFFEQVANAMLGGELCRNEDGDLCLWRADTTVEVKSSYVQSQYGFRLDIEQIESYKRLAVFPFSRALYVLIAYDNPKCRKTGSNSMSPCKTPRKIAAYLADKVSWAAAIDLSIVSRWKEVLSVSEKSVLGHLGTRTVNVKCRMVHELTNGGFKENILMLGLNPDDYRVLKGPATFQTGLDLLGPRVLSFPFSAVLPKQDTEGFQRRMRRRGIYLKQG